MMNEKENVSIKENISIKERVRANYETIARSIDAKGHIVNKLFEATIFTIDQVAVFNDSANRETRTDHLLKELFRTAYPSAFVVFKEALRENYPWIVELLKPTEITSESDGGVVSTAATAASPNETPVPAPALFQPAPDFAEAIIPPLPADPTTVPVPAPFPFVIDADELTISNLVGKGSYGSVYKARHPFWETVAYKKLDVGIIGVNDKAELIAEAQSHSKLNHPNIVKCLGVVFEPDNYGLIFEYMEQNILRFLGWNSYLDLKLRFVNDVASGMCYLHNQNPSVIHGDLKIHNVLLGPNRRAAIVSDFGFPSWKNYSKGHSVNKVPPGTITHVPPERLRNKNLRKSEAGDVYSFGITVWEMITLKPPFENAGGRPDFIERWVLRGQRPDCSERQPNWKSVPQRIVNMVYMCWNEDATKRPSFADIVKVTENFP